MQDVSLKICLFPQFVCVPPLVDSTESFKSFYIFQTIGESISYRPGQDTTPAHTAGYL